MRTHHTMIHRHISALLLAAAMFTGSTAMPAFAAASDNPFKDVAADVPYAAGVQYAYENGITAGTGPTTFSPDSNVTFGELSLMLCRMFWPEKEWDLDTATEYVAADKMGYIINPVDQRDASVASGIAYSALFACGGTPVFSESLYNHDSDKEGRVGDAVFTAIQLGLCTEDESDWKLITRGEAVQMMYEWSLADIEAPAPPIVDKLQVEIEDGYKAKCSQFLEAVAGLPQVILDRFEDEGWKLVIGDNELLQWNAENGGNAVGLTKYSDKAIYTRSMTSVIHEFGHFLHDQLGRPLRVDELYELEAEQARPVIGEYAMTNESEYFAEFFEKWMNWTDSKLQELQKVAPQTYAYFAQLEANGWLPVES